MNRKIKFRGNTKEGQWFYGDLLQTEIKEIFKDGELTKVLPETVGQFTGLKDKNGVEIYEGDILKFGNNNTTEVTFENGCFNVFDEPLGWDFDSEEVPIKALMSYCKVIGNIHENPELL